MFTNVTEVLAASIIGVMMEAARTSETLVNFYQTTTRYNPETTISVTFLIHFHEVSINCSDL
jgi:hypothetical protein